MVRATVVRSTMGPSTLWALLCPFIMGSTMGSTTGPTMGSTIAFTTIVKVIMGGLYEGLFLQPSLVGWFLSSIMGSMVCSLRYSN